MREPQNGPMLRDFPVGPGETAQEKAWRLGQAALAKTYNQPVKDNAPSGSPDASPRSGNAVPLRAGNSMKSGMMSQNESVPIDLMHDGSGIHSSGPGEDYHKSEYKVNG